jgi:hypothetical protein
VWPDEAKRGVGVDVPEGGFESDIVVAGWIEVQFFDRYLGWIVFVDV